MHVHSHSSIIPLWNIVIPPKTNCMLDQLNENQQKIIRERSIHTYRSLPVGRHITIDDVAWTSGESLPPIAPLDDTSCAIFIRMQMIKKNLMILHHIQEDFSSFKSTLSVLAEKTHQVIEIFFLSGKGFNLIQLLKIKRILRNFQTKYPDKFILKDDLSHFITLGAYDKPEALRLMATVDSQNAQPLAVFSLNKPKKTKKT